MKTSASSPASLISRNFRHASSSIALAVAAAFALSHSAQAASGTWTNNNASTWSSTGNWSGGAVADGAGFTADFSTLDITAGRTVTIDGAVASRTLGTLLVGDTTAAFQGYTFASTGGGTLTFNSSGAGAVLTQAANTGSNSFNSTLGLILADNLTINNNANNTAARSLTISGGITGTGSLTINANGSGSSAGSAITINTTAVNNTGTITNSGTGTGTTTLATVGSNVTGVTQNSGTSPLTVTTLNMNNAGTTLTSGGTSLFTVTDQITSGSSTPNLTVSANSTGNITLTGGFNVAGSILNNGSGTNTVTIGAIGSNVTTGVTQNAASSTLLLNGAGLYTGGTTITAGTLRVGNATALGADSSAVSVASGAVLDVNGTTMTGANALTLNGAGTGAGGLINSSSTAATYAGAITLGSNSTIGSSGTGNTFTVSGGVTGAFNLTLRAAGTQAISLLTNSVNNGGTITNSGAGSGTTTIATVGSNVTGVTQNSATSALTITTLSSPFSTTLTNSNAALLSVTNQITGTGNISASNYAINGAGGITLTGGANNAGTITNNNSGTGTFTIGAVGSNVTGVTQNSATSALLLNGANTYTGSIAVNAGTLTFSNAGNQSFGAIDGAGTVQNAVGAGQLSFTQAASTTYSIGTLTNSTTTGPTGAFTLNGGAGSSTTIGTVNGANGSQVIFGGSSTGSTTITNRLNALGQLVRVTAGTVTLAATGSSNPHTTNLQLDGGTLTTSGDRIALNGNGQTLTITGGQLLIPSSGFGLRINGTSGANATGTAGNTFTGTQSGGTVNIFKGGQNSSFSLGSNSTTVSTYNMQGGVLNALGAGTDGRVELGADTAGTGKATFNFSGGKVIASGQISGSQVTAARQAFVWTGGTLVTANYIATNLTSTDGATYSGNVGTLTNGGGILAPGDIGTAGRTVITGNYSVTSPNASLAVDIGGTTQASTFQNGLYDFVSVTNGAATLGGRLNFGIINNYVAPNDVTTRFNVLASTGTGAGLSGTFANLVTATGGNNRVVGADGLTSFLVGINTTASTANTGGLTSVNARTVALGGYQAGNTYNAASSGTWDAAAAASWTNFDPGATATPATQASGAIAQFADGSLTGSGTNSVTLNGTRNIQGVQFSSATAGHNYTISGSGALVLDNTSNNAASTITDSSASGNVNAINNVPITLNSNLVVSVTNASNTLAVGSAISGTGRSLTKTGLGTLTLSGANAYTGSTTVSSGTLLLGNNSAITTATANSAPSGSAVTLSGGNIGFVGDISEGNTTTTGVGALTLSATSSIDFGAGVDLIHFAASGSQTWTGTLNIFNWTQGSDRLLFGTADSSTSLTAGQLSQISFYSGANTLSSFLGNGAFTGTGNGDLTFTAVPEPSTYIGGGLILGLAAWSQRKRWNQLKVS